MICREAAVIGRMPVLRGNDELKTPLQFIRQRDDFITVRYLSGGASTEPLSVKIYNFSRGTLTPAINAAATFLLFSTLIVALVGVYLYRRVTRGERGQTREISEYLT